MKLTYRPDSSAWSVGATLRYGKTNSGTTREHREMAGDRACAFGTAYGYDFAALWCDPASAKYRGNFVKTATNWSASDASSREEHMLVDFQVGRDLGLGSVLSRSTAAAGLRYAQFKSSSNYNALSVSGWDIADAFRKYNAPPSSEFSYDVHLSAEREFKGAGPTLSWNGASHLLGSDQTGRLDVDWSVVGGVLFGKQTTSFAGSGRKAFYQGDVLYWPFPQVGEAQVFSPPAARSKSVSVPLVDLSLGLSYDVQRIRLSTGYRWERYFNVLDAGYAERKAYDRTMDGPYVKASVGFGG